MCYLHTRTHPTERTDGRTARIEIILCVNSCVVQLTRAGTSCNNVKKCVSPWPDSVRLSATEEYARTQTLYQLLYINLGRQNYDTKRFVSRDCTHWWWRASRRKLVWLRNDFSYKGCCCRYYILDLTNSMEQRTSWDAKPFWHSENGASCYILIMKANEMHYFSNLFDKVRHMFRTGPLSIIRNISALYTQQ
jgi:hypothetical protein